ncbi:MAG: hypothetical protein HWN65_01425 [Candidatus Helarchaeota archaeon]|nr:hypothetical protein [Candidatus Helarchaeota archaeon]
MKECVGSKKISFIEAIYKHQEQLQKRILLSDFTGLNQIMGKGFESGLFYLIYGSSHITNSILLSMAVAAQLPIDKGGLESSVVFIDNDNIFNPYSLIRLALSVNLNSTSVLSRIFVARAFIWNHLGEIVDNLEGLLEKKRARVVLISGLTTLFEGEFERKKHQMLMKIANKLRNIAIDNEIIVVASAQLAQGSSHKPAGGKIISHTPHVLVCVLQQGERISFNLVKHPSRSAQQIVQFLTRRSRPPHTVPLDRFLKKPVEQ